MDPKDIPEEHRKYLEMSDNPEKPTNTSIFALLSDVRVAIGKMETKQENTHAYLDDVAKKVEKLDDSVNDKIEVLEDDFKQCQISSMGQRGAAGERNKWFMRAIALMISLSLASLGLLFWHLGIPFP